MRHAAHRVAQVVGRYVQGKVFPIQLMVGEGLLDHVLRGITGHRMAEQGQHGLNRWIAHVGSGSGKNGPLDQRASAAPKSTLCLAGSGFARAVDDNKAMRCAHVFIALLIAATLGTDLAVLVVLSKLRPSYHNMGLEIVYAMATGQVNLLAAWMAFRGKTLPLRLVVVTLAAAVWGLGVAAAFSEPHDTGMLIVILLIQAMFVAIAFGIARWTGLALVDVAPTKAADRTITPTRPWQFSISDLFAWLTSTAVILGICKSTIDFGVFGSELPEAIIELIPVIPVRRAFWEVLFGPFWAQAGHGSALPCSSRRAARPSTSSPGFRTSAAPQSE